MSVTQDKPYDLFISYADADRAWVEGYLLDALSQAGVRCQTEATFSLGVPRLEEFERAIHQSRRTLLVLSSASAADGFTRFTGLMAQSYGAEAAAWPVILIVRAEIEMPMRLAMLPKVDATKPSRWPEVVKRLCDELHHPVPGPAPRPTCPYPGMIPFRAQDARFFYGREVEIEKMVQHLRHQRCLFVIGPSGSGKSSLIHAGLLPRLAQSGYFPPDFWLVRTMRPGNKPLHTLTEILGATLTQRSQALADLIVAHPPAQRMLVVVDQFEELFAQNDHAEQSRFIATLKALRTEEHVAILLGMRADFYQDLMNSDLWPVDLSQRLEIGPLRGEPLRQAIKRPAAEVGVYLEAGLLERLLADADEEPGVLPLVQETMVLLWDKMQRHLLPYSEYEKLGQDGPNGLTVAMAMKADATLAQLTDAQQKIARRIFLRLVQFGEGRADTRRQQSLEELRSAKDDRAEFDQTLEHLTRHRLLTRSGEDDARGPVVDIAHEMLIIGWPRSQEWVQSRREAELVRRRLEAKAAEWAERVRQGQGGGLLDETELPEAERWLRTPDAEDLGYDHALTALVQASRSALAELEQQRESARQRELQQAQALAAEQRRRAKTLSRSLIVSGVLLAVAVVMAVVAWRSNQSLKKEEAKRLEGYAKANAKLAREAIRRGDWIVALDASQTAFQAGYPEAEGIDLRLGRVKAFAALNRLRDANEEVAALSERTDLGNYEGSVLLWKGDLLLTRSYGNWAEAKNLINRGLGMHLEDSERAYAKALLADTTPEGIDHLREVLRQDPWHQRANGMLAIIYLYSGRLVEAQERLTFAESAFPQDPTFGILQALTSALKNDPKAAAQQLEKVRPFLDEAQFASARALVKLHRELNILRDLVETDANLATVIPKMLAFVNRAKMLDLNIQADPSLANDLALPPIHPAMYQAFSRASTQAPKVALLAFLNPDPLIAEIAETLRVFPEGMLYFLHGMLLYHNKRWHEAEQSLLRASVTPSILGSVRRQALYLAIGCQIEISIGPPVKPEMRAKIVRTLRELVLEIVRSDGMRSDQATELSQIALALGEFDLARWIVLEWERQMPDDLKMLRQRLTVESKAGNYWGAIQAADRILKREPQDKEALQARSEAVENLRKQAEAANASR